MLKKCSNCQGHYYARWRNEPVSLCPECKAGLTICSRCGATDRPPPDPLQLTLFPAIFGTRQRVEPELEDFYYELRRQASAALRRRYPYC